MLGSLNTEQCKYILRQNNVGRIGCYADNKMLIIPITYVCDGQHIYGHSLEGEKIRMMRKNPKVCFQVDVIEDLANWRSVLAWGTFEELKSDSLQRTAKTLFLERLAPIKLGETVDPSREFANPPHVVQKKRKPVVYRIVIEELSGRYEKQTT